MCILKDAFDFENPSEISNFIKAENLEAAVALHLYRGGRLLRGNLLSSEVKRQQSGKPGVPVIST